MSSSLIEIKKRRALAAEVDRGEEELVFDGEKRVKLARAKEHNDVVNLTSAFVVEAHDEEGNPLISSSEDLVALLKGSV